MAIGAHKTPAFKWKPTHWSMGPFILWAMGIAILLLVRVLVQSPQEYASTVGFVIPLIDLSYIIWAVFATFQSGGRLSDLGITRKYGLLALCLGLLAGFAIMGIRSLDPRFAGYLQFTMEPLPLTVLIIGGAFHAFAEEVLFRGYFVGRLSKDFGWVPAVIISGLVYGLAPFAFLGADPLSTNQIAEIGKFFISVFPAVTLLGVFLALVYRIIGSIITTWFAVTLSIWALGFIKGGMGANLSYPVFSLVGYILLALSAIIIVTLLMKHYGHKLLKLNELKNIIE